MAAGVRFIHAADLHLDAPFGSVGASDERVRETLVASTRRALDRIVEACIEHRVDFLVLAGDVHNSRERGIASQFALKRAAERLAEAGIGVYIVCGNHDPHKDARTVVELPGNVYTFPAGRVERVVFERDGEILCALYGRSFEVTAETENFARGFRRDPADRVAIGILHTNVGSREGYDDYAPCTAADLEAAGMDYWALGHIHVPGEVLPGARAVYAGCPQGLDPTQTGPRGCYLVELDDGPPVATFIPTASVLWETLDVDVSDCTLLDEVRDAIRDACEAVLDRAGGAPVICRVVLRGRTDAHTALAQSQALEALVGEIHEHTMAETPWLWIDRLTDRTGGRIDIDALRQAQDFAGTVVRIADEADLERDLEAHLRELVGKAKDAAPELDLRDIIGRARDVVLDRIIGEEER